MVTTRRIFTDDDEPPPPSVLREIADVGGVADKLLTHFRGMLRDPAERQGLRFVVDLVKGKSPDPGAAGPTIKAEGEAVNAKDTVMRFDINKLMDELTKALDTLVLLQGDRRIKDLPALMQQHRASVVEQVKTTLAGCIVYEVPDDEADGQHAGQGDGGAGVAGDGKE